MLFCNRGGVTSVQIFKHYPHVTPASCVLAMENRDKAGVKIYTRHACGNSLIP